VTESDTAGHHDTQ